MAEPEYYGDDGTLLYSNIGYNIDPHKTRTGNKRIDRLVQKAEDAQRRAKGMHFK